MSESEQSEEELHDIDWNEADPFFYEDPFALSPQISAVIENDVERLKLLLESGKSVNINDNNGNTPLHVAVLKDKQEAFEYLLGVEDVRVNAANFDGATPLHLALAASNAPFALSLLAAGANPSAPGGPLGLSPLHLAASAPSLLPVALSLLAGGADPSAPSALDGETPLHAACRAANADLVHALLYYGAAAAGASPPLDLAIAAGRCDPALLETLFLHTFDDDAPGLRTLALAMRWKSPLFERIVEDGHRRELVYDVEDLKELNRALPRVEASVLRVFIRNYEEVAADMFHLCTSLDDYLTFLSTHLDGRQDFVDFVYAVCDSPSLAPLFVTAHKPQSCPLVYPLINLKLSEETTTGLICCLLSYGADIVADDLNCVYKLYGFCDLFKIMLHMRIVGGDHENIGTFLMPALIYDVNLDIDKCLLEPDKYFFPENLKKLFRFFALPKLKEYCLRSFAQDDPAEFVKNVRCVPSLVELGRNAARKFIIEKYKVKDCAHFFTVLRWLPIGQIYKCILSYEKEIYNV